MFEQLQVLVHRKPVIAILSTGNEIGDLQQKSLLTKNTDDSVRSITWDTNRPSLHAAMVRMGYEVIDLGIVPDE